VAFDPFASDRPLIVYVDHKSPYAFLAVEPTIELCDALGVAIDWRPLTLDIPSYLGSARLGAKGEVVESQRSATQWTQVKYAYRDARRYASLRGWTVRGTTKIWDTSLAGQGMLCAKAHGDAVLRRYNALVFERFWKRELDIECAAALAGVLTECGVETGAFSRFLDGEGRRQLDDIQAEAEAAGVFGVPSFLLDDGDLYWGREHISRIREILAVTNN